jgi:hypothetical protein
MPSRNLVPGTLLTALGALVVAVVSLFNFRERGAGEAGKEP